VYNSNTMNRLTTIRDAINEGKRPTEIADDLGVSRERIRQLIEKIPIEQLHPPCHYCGAPMEPLWGKRHKYHKSCIALLARDRGREANRLKRWHQRKSPAGLFESIALAEYGRRKFDVLWMPQQAPFDYVVNHKRVDVKGSRVNSDGKWQWPINLRLPSWAGQDITTRCDIVHLVGLGAESWGLTDYCVHLIIPSFLLKNHTAVTMAAEPRRKPKWDDFRDNWDALKKKA